MFSAASVISWGCAAWLRWLLHGARRPKHIGEIGLRSLSRLLQGLAEDFGREINPFVLSPKEFIKRKIESEQFISKVLISPKLFIIGDENDLKTMA
jgi:hypothetical protein